MWWCVMWLNIHSGFKIADQPCSLLSPLTPSPHGLHSSPPAGLLLSWFLTHTRSPFIELPSSPPWPPPHPSQAVVINNNSDVGHMSYHSLWHKLLTSRAPSFHNLLPLPNFHPTPPTCTTPRDVTIPFFRLTLVPSPQYFISPPPPPTTPSPPRAVIINNNCNLTPLNPVSKCHTRPPRREIT